MTDEESEQVAAGMHPLLSEAQAIGTAAELPGGSLSYEFTYVTARGRRVTFQKHVVLADDAVVLDQFPDDSLEVVRCDVRRASDGEGDDERVNELAFSLATPAAVSAAREWKVGTILVSESGHGCTYDNGMPFSFVEEVVALTWSGDFSLTVATRSLDASKAILNEAVFGTTTIDERVDSRASRARALGSDGLDALACDPHEAFGESDMSADAHVAFEQAGVARVFLVSVDIDKEAFARKRPPAAQSDAAVVEVHTMHSAESRWSVAGCARPQARGHIHAYHQLPVGDFVDPFDTLWFEVGYDVPDFGWFAFRAGVAIVSFGDFDAQGRVTATVRSSGDDVQVAEVTLFCPACQRLSREGRSASAGRLLQQSVSDVAWTETVDVGGAGLSETIYLLGSDEVGAYVALDDLNVGVQGVTLKYYADLTMLVVDVSGSLTTGGGFAWKVDGDALVGGDIKDFLPTGVPETFQVGYDVGAGFVLPGFFAGVKARPWEGEWDVRLGVQIEGGYGYDFALPFSIQGGYNIGTGTTISDTSVGSLTPTRREYEWQFSASLTIMPSLALRPELRVGLWFLNDAGVAYASSIFPADIAAWIQVDPAGVQSNPTIEPEPVTGPAAVVGECRDDDDPMPSTRPALQVDVIYYFQTPQLYAYGELNLGSLFSPLQVRIPANEDEFYTIPALRTRTIDGIDFLFGPVYPLRYCALPVPVPDEDIFEGVEECPAGYASNVVTKVTEPAVWYAYLFDPSVTSFCSSFPGICAGSSQTYRTVLSEYPTCVPCPRGCSKCRFLPNTREVARACGEEFSLVCEECETGYGLKPYIYAPFLDSSLARRGTDAHCPVSECEPCAKSTPNCKECVWRCGNGDAYGRACVLPDKRAYMHCLSCERGSTPVYGDYEAVDKRWLDYTAEEVFQETDPGIDRLRLQCATTLQQPRGDDDTPDPEADEDVVGGLLGLRAAANATTNTTSPVEEDEEDDSSVALSAGTGEVKPNPYLFDEELDAGECVTETGAGFENNCTVGSFADSAPEDEAADACPGEGCELDELGECVCASSDLVDGIADPCDVEEEPKEVSQAFRRAPDYPLQMLFGIFCDFSQGDEVSPETCAIFAFGGGSHPCAEYNAPGSQLDAPPPIDAILVLTLAEWGISTPIQFEVTLKFQCSRPDPSDPEDKMGKVLSYEVIARYETEWVLDMSTIGFEQLGKALSPSELGFHYNSATAGLKFDITFGGAFKLRTEFDKTRDARFSWYMELVRTITFNDVADFFGLAPTGETAHPAVQFLEGFLDVGLSKGSVFVYEVDQRQNVRKFLFNGGFVAGGRTIRFSFSLYKPLPGSRLRKTSGVVGISLVDVFAILKDQPGMGFLNTLFNFLELPSDASEPSQIDFILHFGDEGRFDKIDIGSIVATGPGLHTLATGNEFQEAAARKARRRLFGSASATSPVPSLAGERSVRPNERSTALRAGSPSFGGDNVPAPPRQQYQRYNTIRAGVWIDPDWVRETAVGKILDLVGDLLSAVFGDNVDVEIALEGVEIIAVRIFSIQDLEIDPGRTWMKNIEAKIAFTIIPFNPVPELSFSMEFWFRVDAVEGPTDLMFETTFTYQPLTNAISAELNLESEQGVRMTRSLTMYQIYASVGLQIPSLLPLQIGLAVDGSYGAMRLQGGILVDFTNPVKVEFGFSVRVFGLYGRQVGISTVVDAFLADFSWIFFPDRPSLQLPELARTGLDLKGSVGSVQLRFNPLPIAFTLGSLEIKQGYQVEIVNYKFLMFTVLRANFEWTVIPLPQIDAELVVAPTSFYNILDMYRSSTQRNDGPYCRFHSGIPLPFRRRGQEDASPDELLQRAHEHPQTKEDGLLHAAYMRDKLERKHQLGRYSNMDTAAAVRRGLQQRRARSQVANVEDVAPTRRKTLRVPDPEEVFVIDCEGYLNFMGIEFEFDVYITPVFYSVEASGTIFGRARIEMLKELDMRRITQGIVSLRLRYALNSGSNNGVLTEIYLGFRDVFVDKLRSIIDSLVAEAKDIVETAIRIARAGFEAAKRELAKAEDTIRRGFAYLDPPINSAARSRDHHRRKADSKRCKWTRPWECVAKAYHRGMQGFYSGLYNIARGVKTAAEQLALSVLEAAKWALSQAEELVMLVLEGTALFLEAITSIFDTVISGFLSAFENVVEFIEMIMNVRKIAVDMEITTGGTSSMLLDLEVNFFSLGWVDITLHCTFNLVQILGEMISAATKYIWEWLRSILPSPADFWPFRRRSLLSLATDSNFVLPLLPGAGNITVPTSSWRVPALEAVAAVATAYQRLDHIHEAIRRVHETEEERVHGDARRAARRRAREQPSEVASLANEVLAPHSAVRRALQENGTASTFFEYAALFNLTTTDELLPPEEQAEVDAFIRSYDPAAVQAAGLTAIDGGPPAPIDQMQGRLRKYAESAVAVDAFFEDSLVILANDSTAYVPKGLLTADVPFQARQLQDADVEEKANQTVYVALVPAPGEGAGASRSVCSPGALWARTGLEARMAEAPRPARVYAPTGRVYAANEPWWTVAVQQSLVTGIDTWPLPDGAVTSGCRIAKDDLLSEFAAFARYQLGTDMVKQDLFSAWSFEVNEPQPAALSDAIRDPCGVRIEVTRTEGHDVAPTAGGDIVVGPVPQATVNANGTLEEPGELTETLSCSDDAFSAYRALLDRPALRHPGFPGGALWRAPGEEGGKGSLGDPAYMRLQLSSLPERIVTGDGTEGTVESLELQQVEALLSTGGVGAAFVDALAAADVVFDDGRGGSLRAVHGGLPVLTIDLTAGRAESLPTRVVSIEFGAAGGGTNTTALVAALEASVHASVTAALSGVSGEHPTNSVFTYAEETTPTNTTTALGQRSLLAADLSQPESWPLNARRNQQAGPIVRVSVHLGGRNASSMALAAHTHLSSTATQASVATGAAALHAGGASFTVLSSPAITTLGGTVVSSTTGVPATTPAPTPAPVAPTSAPAAPTAAPTTVAPDTTPVVPTAAPTTVAADTPAPAAPPGASATSAPAETTEAPLAPLELQFTLRLLGIAECDANVQAQVGFAVRTVLGRRAQPALSVWPGGCSGTPADALREVDASVSFTVQLQFAPSVNLDVVAQALASQEFVSQLVGELRGKEIAVASATLEVAGRFASAGEPSGETGVDGDGGAGGRSALSLAGPIVGVSAAAVAVVAVVAFFVLLKVRSNVAAARSAVVPTPPASDYGTASSSARVLSVGRARTPSGPRESGALATEQRTTGSVSRMSLNLWNSWNLT